MRIEATIQEISALLQLADLDAQPHALPPETHRSRREAGRKRIAQELLDRYEILLEAGRRPVIVAIVEGSCSGCHLRLPTMVESLAHCSLAIHSCPHCRRMLYAPELLTGADSKGVAAQKQRAPGRAAHASGEERP